MPVSVVRPVAQPPQSLWPHHRPAVLLLQLAGNFDLVWSMVAANQQTAVSSSNPVMSVKGTTTPVQVAASDFYVGANGDLVSRNLVPIPARRRSLLQTDDAFEAPILKTAPATKVQTAEDAPRNIIHIYVDFNDAASRAFFKLKVNGFVTIPTSQGGR